MDENKKLNEKELEGVTGGELMDAATKVGPQRAYKGCLDCALSDRTDCVYFSNQELKLKKMMGQEDCSGFVPEH